MSEMNQIANFGFFRICRLRGLVSGTCSGLRIRNVQIQKITLRFVLNFRPFQNWKKLQHFLVNSDHHPENIPDLVIRNVQIQKLTVAF